MCSDRAFTYHAGAEAAFPVIEGGELPCQKWE